MLIHAGGKNVRAEKTKKFEYKIEVRKFSDLLKGDFDSDESESK